MGKDNRFYTVTKCTKEPNTKVKIDSIRLKATADPLSTACFISMKALFAKPFLLKAND
jgi:hypothetical protein